MKKRILSILLACMMVFSFIPGTVFAENEHNHVHATAEEAADGCPGKDKTHTLTNCPDAEVYEVVPAKCDKWGYTIYQCPVCGAYFAADFVKSEDGAHVWKVTSKKVEPTCEKDGKEQVETCELCGETRGGQTIKALGHEWKVTGTDGDCLTGGFTYYECSRCGEEKKVPIAETGEGHKWSKTPVEIVKEPDCGNKGEAIYECERCGERKSVEILPNGRHNLVEHKEVKATCETDGSIAYWECTICGKYFTTKEATEEVSKDKNGAYVTVVEKLGHDVKEWKTDKLPTCTEAGSKSGTCDRCKEKITESIPATGHSYAKEPTTEIKPTCTMWGFKVYACLICGEAKPVESEPPLGHTAWDDETSKDKVEVVATCDKDGSRTWKCGRCDEEQTETVEKLGHKLMTQEVLASCARFGYVFTYCARENCPLELKSVYTKDGKDYDVTVEGKPVHLIDCTVGDTLDPNNHHIENGTVNEPTCTKDGLKVGYCTDCNQYSTQIVKALGHDWDDGVVTQKQSCTTDEIVKYTCKRDGCGETYTETTKKATGHTWYNGKVIEPTCSAKGYTLFTCKTCGTTKKENETDYQPRTEYTLEQAMKEHNPVYVEVFREGSCTIIGLYKYYCQDCGNNILVVMEDTGTHKWVKTPGKAPTCTEPGVEEKWVCERCQEVDKEHDGKVIKALGHDWKNYEEVPATCEKDGVSAYRECQRCKLVEGKTVLPKIDHANATYVDSREASCEEYGYKHYYCPDCGKEFIVEYEPAWGHDWVLDKNASTAPGCETPGENVYVCQNAEHDPEKETVAPTGHKNKAGEAIVNDCMDTTEDRHCVNCGEEVGKDHHKLVTVHVDATCLEYGYDLILCENCGWSEVTNVDKTYLADHTWGDWYTVKEPTFTDEGLEERECKVCKEKETRKVAPKVGFDYLLDIDNAVVSGASFVDSALVAVKVSMKSAGVDIWALNFELDYDNSVMVFEGYETLSPKFELYMINDVPKSGHVNVLAQVPNTEDKKAADTHIEGTEELVILYFRINNKDARSATFSFGNRDTLNTEDIQIQSTGETETIKILPFLDVNGDGMVTLTDAYYAYRIVIEALYVDDELVEYDAVVDVNKDGIITLYDVNVIYQFIVEALAYEDVVALGVE